MLSLLPDFVDPARLCGLGKVYEGVIPLSELPRLAPLLTSSGGEAAFVLAFSMDGERRGTVRVEVRANLAIQCQRCLGEMTLNVDSASQLALVYGPDEAEKLPVDLDPLVVEDEKVALRSLIVDELILAIPPAPSHEPDECAVSLSQLNRDSENVTETIDEEGKPHPFAALAALKRDPNIQD